MKLKLTKGIQAFRYERNQKKSPTWIVQPSQTSYGIDLQEIKRL
jgi:hypothetical protein